MTETEETTETAEEETPLCGLIPVRGAKEDWMHISSTSVMGDRAALLVYENTPGVDFGGEAEVGPIPQSVFLLDAGRAAGYLYKGVESKLDNVDSIVLDEDLGISLIDTFDEKKEVFSPDMRSLGIEDCPYKNPVEAYDENPMVNDRFSRYDYAAKDYIWADGHRIADVLAFPHEKTLRIGLLPFEDIVAADGGLFLGCLSSDGGKKLTFIVYDAENGLILNRVETPEGMVSEGEWLWPLGCAVGEEYAVIGIQASSEDQLSRTSLYVWPYRNGAFSEECPLESYELEDLREENRQMAEEIGEKYGLEIHLDEAPEGFDPAENIVIDGEEPMIGELSLGVEEYDNYSFLSGLEAFFERLPEGMVKELYQNLPNGDELAPLKVYLVEEIHGEAAAFANRYEMYACFASTEYTYDQFPHEFMHLLDARIFAAYDVENGTLGGFYEFWDTLNSPDFGYKYWEDEYEFDPEYFVSSYAMKQAEEDRAEIFMYLFQSAYQKEPPAWYSEHAPLAHKTDVLLDWIRKAFPSVAKTGKAYWEITE